MCLMPQVQVQEYDRGVVSPVGLLKFMQEGLLSFTFVFFIPLCASDKLKWK